jgi:uncharacterized membrane protein
MPTDDDEPTGSTFARALRAVPTPIDPDARTFEEVPLTRNEYITAIVHFYRGEVARSTEWRKRLDATTNWAVVSAAALLSFSFNNPEAHHVVILMANVIIFAFLVIEARRFRHFAVYRARVRMIEENFLIPIVSRKLWSPMGAKWREIIANDLHRPKYKNTLLQAVRFRLRRNYLWIFVALLCAWVTKLALHPVPAHDFEHLWEHAKVGGALPPGVVVGIVVAFELMLFFISLSGGGDDGDEIHGLEKHPDRWTR